MAKCKCLECGAVFESVPELGNHVCALAIRARLRGEQVEYVSDRYTTSYTKIEALEFAIRDREESRESLQSSIDEYQSDIDQYVREIELYRRALALEVASESRV
jgi:uncharacterized protein YlxW (UPF0749 family)